MTKEDKIKEAAETAYPYNDLRDIAFIEGATSEAAKEYFDPIGFAKFLFSNYTPVTSDKLQRIAYLPDDVGEILLLGSDDYYTGLINKYGLTVEGVYEQFKNKK